jgi:hypothetical protein
MFAYSFARVDKRIEADLVAFLSSPSQSGTFPLHGKVLSGPKVCRLWLGTRLEGAYGGGGEHRHVLNYPTMDQN